MQKQSFIIGALILVLASFINRIIGFIYRIVIVRIVGAEGIGLYEMVFPVYIMVLVLATAGIPLAVSRLVSGRVAVNDMSGAFKVFRIALFFLFFSGLFFSILLYALVPLLIEIAFSDPRVEIIFKTMIPAIFFISISSAFRGFFQGMQQMTPTALTQTVEQLTRVLIGFYLAKLMLPYGLEYGVTGLAIGMVIGELTGLLVIIMIYFKKAPVMRSTYKTSLTTVDIFKGIFSLSVPITLTRAFATIVLAIEAVLLPQRLQATGLTLKETATIYGQYSGMALPLLVLPTILTISLAITLVPAISEAAAKKNYYSISSRINKSLQLTILVGIPSSIIFYFWGPELTLLLFNNAEAGEILKFLSFGSMFLYMQQTTSGILQGLGAVKVTLINSLVGGSIRLGGIYFLAAIPNYGIYGALIAVNTSFIAMAFLNIFSIAKITGLRLDGKSQVLKPLWCGLLLIIFVMILRWNLVLLENNSLNLIREIILTAAMYVMLLLLHRVISIKNLVNLINSFWR